AAQAELAAGAAAGGHARGRDPARGPHLHLGAVQRLPRRDRYVRLHVRAAHAVDLAGRQLDRQQQVAGLGTVGARLAQPTQAHGEPVAHVLGDLQRDRLRGAHRADPGARRTDVIAEEAHAAAARARARGGQRELALAAGDRLVRGQLERGAHVGAALGVARVPARPPAHVAPHLVAEEAGEEVRERARAAEHARELLRIDLPPARVAGELLALLPARAELVVALALVRIGEHLVSLADLLELRLGLGALLLRVAVGVPPHRELAVGLLDVLGGSVARDAEHGVVVLELHHG